MQAREDDYLRFARDLRVPFTNNEAERAIRMSKLRIKVSGCMRSTAGAQEFCAIRSYLSTAARHGTGALDALTGALQGRPWIPETGWTSPAERPARPSRNRGCGSSVSLAGGPGTCPVLPAPMEGQPRALAAGCAR
jgi:hypothetical protein